MEIGVAGSCGRYEGNEGKAKVANDKQTVGLYAKVRSFVRSFTVIHSQSFIHSQSAWVTEQHCVAVRESTFNFCFCFALTFLF